MDFEYKAFFNHLYDRVFEEDILGHAAQVAFYFSFALFPLLFFLISLFGLILESADALRSELFYYLQQIMPHSAYMLVSDTIKEVTETSTGGKLTLGFLIALWSASAGVESLRVTLNSTYNLKDEKAWWKSRALSILITLVLTVLIFIALGLILYGWQLLLYLINSLGLPVPASGWLIVLQWIIIFLTLLLIFGILYNFLPAHKGFKWHWISPGAITGIVLWILLSYGFQIYLSYFGNYSATYGSLGAMIILMLWLYLTAVVILLGGMINSIIKKMDTEKDSDENFEDKNAGESDMESENPAKDSADKSSEKDNESVYDDEYKIKDKYKLDGKDDDKEK